jgi:hypothetical protein
MNFPTIFFYIDKIRYHFFTKLDECREYTYITFCQKKFTRQIHFVAEREHMDPRQNWSSGLTTAIRLCQVQPKTGAICIQRKERAYSCARNKSALIEWCTGIHIYMVSINHEQRVYKLSSLYQTEASKEEVLRAYKQKAHRFGPSLMMKEKAVPWTKIQVHHNIN